MSKIQVDTIVNNNDDGAPTFTMGAVVSGIITATTFNGNATGLTGSPNITVGVITATTINAGGSIPVGGIIMWSGSIASIPSGWALCNGSNSTPNLTDKFIIGAGNSYAVGGTAAAINGGSTFAYYALAFIMRTV